jgi:hypothetical protein
MFKGENQRNASVVGCEECKDHYVANPFTFTSVQVQIHEPSNRRTRAVFSPPKLGSHHPDAHKFQVSNNTVQVSRKAFLQQTLSLSALLLAAQYTMPRVFTVSAGISLCVSCAAKLQRLQRA